MARILKSWLPVLVWMCLIFAGSTDQGSAGNTSGFVEPFLRWLMPQLSQEGIDRLHFLIRKCGHLTEYAILGALALRALAPASTEAGAKRRWKIAALALAIAALYAASDEFHQRFVPSRGASFEDVLLDACGASAGIAALLLFRKRNDKNES
jgi:VanZ family protein